MAAGIVPSDEIREAERRDALVALLRRLPEHVQRMIAEEGERRQLARGFK